MRLRDCCSVRSGPAALEISQESNKQISPLPETQPTFFPRKRVLVLGRSGVSGRAGPATPGMDALRLPQSGAQGRRRWSLVLVWEPSLSDPERKPGEGETTFRRKN